MKSPSARECINEMCVMVFLYVLYYFFCICKDFFLIYVLFESVYIG